MRFSVTTRDREGFADITSDVAREVETSGVAEGIVTVFVRHTTAGVTINENADPDVIRDMLDTLCRLAPKDSGYRHAEGNSDSHMKASLMGSSVSVPVEGGRMVLGRWQGIYLCEFDGPRAREIVVKVVGF